MSKLAEYFAFAARHPEMFINPSNDGISILLDENEIRMVETIAENEGSQKGRGQVGIVFQNRYLTLLCDAVCFPDGSVSTYIRTTSRIDCGPGVAILPFYHGQVLLIRHFRHATRTWHLEAPRGFGTKDLSGEENAYKELAEEIGAKTSCLISLGQVYPDSGVSADAIELFYATIEAYGDVDVHEGIAEVLPVTVSHLENLILNNEITDSFTIVAYTRAKLRGLL